MKQHPTQLAGLVLTLTREIVNYCAVYTWTTIYIVVSIGYRIAAMLRKWDVRQVVTSVANGLRVRLTLCGPPQYPFAVRRNRILSQGRAIATHLFRHHRCQTIACQTVNLSTRVARHQGRGMVDHRNNYAAQYRYQDLCHLAARGLFAGSLTKYYQIVSCQTQISTEWDVRHWRI